VRKRKPPDSDIFKTKGDKKSAKHILIGYLRETTSGVGCHKISKGLLHAYSKKGSYINTGNQISTVNFYLKAFNNRN
jgi:hypothetical protein